MKNLVLKIFLLVAFAAVMITAQHVEGDDEPPKELPAPSALSAGSNYWRYISTDMTGSLQSYARSYLLTIACRYSNQVTAATYIRRTFDARYGREWHVFVGDGSCSFGLSIWRNARTKWFGYASCASGNDRWVHIYKA